MSDKNSRQITKTGVVSGADLADAEYGAAKVAFLTCVLFDRISDVEIAAIELKPAAVKIGWVPAGESQFSYRITLEGPKDAFRNVRSSR